MNNPLSPFFTPSRLSLPALLLLGLLLWLGLRNRPDPQWIEAGELLRQQYVLAADVPDSLQALYCRLHGVPFRAGDRTAYRLISRPTLPTIGWAAMRDITLTAAQKRFLVVSGVTGTGITKQAKRAAFLIAGSFERVLEIDCAPQFDLEYHKKYIGHDDDEGQFQPGELLQLWEKCRQNPRLRFVAVMDNFDKLNPETFFGPQLWESLSSPRDTAILAGKKVAVPRNFYMISTTHLGPGSLVEFNEEHFKRLGQQYIIRPNAQELVVWLRNQARSLAASDSLSRDDSTRLAALRDIGQMRQFLFYFLKANEFVKERYAEGYQLGQGSNLRPLYRNSDLWDFKHTFLNHINALRPERPMTLSDFKSMDFAVHNDGLEGGSNFVARQIQYLQDTGYLVEITMVATTALLTALAGWWVFRRREQLIRGYGERTQQIYQNFEKQLITAEMAARRLEEIKAEVDSLVLRRQLGYTEGLYFLAFIEDRAKRIEFARNVSENFLELFNAFMEDDVLTEGEYLKLRQFLQSIRHKIPTEVYDQFHQKVERTYAATRQSI